MTNSHFGCLTLSQKFSGFKVCQVKYASKEALTDKSFLSKPSWEERGDKSNRNEWGKHSQK